MPTITGMSAGPIDPAKEKGMLAPAMVTTMPRTSAIQPTMRFANTELMIESIRSDAGVGKGRRQGFAVAESASDGETGHRAKPSRGAENQLAQLVEGLLRHPDRVLVLGRKLLGEHVPQLGHGLVVRGQVERCEPRFQDRAHQELAQQMHL